MIGTVPPSADQAAPVTYEARSEARNAITAAISIGLREAAEGASGADLVEHLVAIPAGLVGEASLPQPGLGGGRPRRDGVAADADAGVEVGDEPRQREHRGLRDRVVRHARRRALPGRRGDVHDRAVRLPEMRQRRPDRADVAHDVQLPHRVPLLVGHVLEAGLDGVADVVDQHVEPVERTHRSLDHRLRAHRARRGRRRRGAPPPRPAPRRART